MNKIIPDRFIIVRVEKETNKVTYCCGKYWDFNEDIAKAKVCNKRQAAGIISAMGKRLKVEIFKIPVHVEVYDETTIRH